MSAIYKYRALGKYGVVTDIPPYDLPPEAWSHANNVRFLANRFEKMGGYAPATLPTTDDSAIHMFVQEPMTDTSALLLGTDKNLWRYASRQYEKINKAGDYVYTPNVHWDYTTLSNVIVFNNENNDPQAWIPGNAAGKVQDLTGWGIPRSVGATAGKRVNWKCKKMRAYKTYLMALNMTEETFNASNAPSGVLKDYPQRVRWSNTAYLGALPPDWIEDSSTNDGGFVDLADCYGSVVDGRQLRDAFIIYTDRETYIMKFVGGEFVFDTQKLFPDSGLLNANCVCEFGGGSHFVISQEDIITHDGSSRTSIATDMVKEYLFDQLTSVNYKAVKCFANPSRHEVWVIYPTISGENGTANYACNKAAIWNWNNGTWTFTDVPDVYWLASVQSPDTDLRQWSNPDQKTLVTPTKITLDSPVYSLPLDKQFRLDCIYLPGEGITTASDLEWSVSPAANADVSEQQLDGSVNFKPKVLGDVTVTVKLKGSTNPDLTDSYTIKITAAGTETGDRHQHSDTADRDSDPLEPKPPYRPDQSTDPDNQWDSNTIISDLWEQKGFSFTDRTFMGASEDHILYYVDTGLRQTKYDADTKTTTSVPVLAEISRYGISMSDVEDSLGRHKTWRTMYPLVSGKGSLRFQIGGSEDPYTMPTTQSSQEFIIGVHYKVDCFVNNKFLSVTIRDDQEGEWSMSGMDVDYFLGGMR